MVRFSLLWSLMAVAAQAQFPVCARLIEIEGLRQALNQQIEASGLPEFVAHLRPELRQKILVAARGMATLPKDETSPSATGLKATLLMSFLDADERDVGEIGRGVIRANTPRPHDKEPILAAQGRLTNLLDLGRVIGQPFRWEAPLLTSGIRQGTAEHAEFLERAGAEEKLLSLGRMLIEQGWRQFFQETGPSKNPAERRFENQAVPVKIVNEAAALFSIGSYYLLLIRSEPFLSQARVALRDLAEKASTPELLAPDRDRHREFPGAPTAQEQRISALYTLALRAYEFAGTKTARWVSKRKDAFRFRLEPDAETRRNIRRICTALTRIEGVFAAEEYEHVILALSTIDDRVMLRELAEELFDKRYTQKNFSLRVAYRLTFELLRAAQADLRASEVLDRYWADCLEKSPFGRDWNFPFHELDELVALAQLAASVPRVSLLIKILDYARFRLEQQEREEAGGDNLSWENLIDSIESDLGDENRLPERRSQIYELPGVSVYLTELLMDIRFARDTVFEAPTPDRLQASRYRHNAQTAVWLGQSPNKELSALRDAPGLIAFADESVKQGTWLGCRNAFEAYVHAAWIERRLALEAAESRLVP